MCGIAGILGGPDNIAAIHAMTAGLRHRGPDGEGYFLDSTRALTLGHRRLAITDPSPEATQPMASRDGRWTICFNGEIFNYAELRRDIAVVLRTASDTEVLLEAIAQWGVDRALPQVNGMFAVALWDSQRKELTLARDRFGEKPLMLLEEPDGLYFASETLALRALSGRRLTPDRQHLRLRHIEPLLHERLQQREPQFGMTAVGGALGRRVTGRRRDLRAGECGDQEHAQCHQGPCNASNHSHLLKSALCRMFPA